MEEDQCSAHMGWNMVKIGMEAVSYVILYNELLGDYFSITGLLVPDMQSTGEALFKWVLLFLFSLKSE